MKLANAKVPVEEQVIPLFVAPPEVCDSAARTVLFAHLPVTASEMTESGPDIPNYGQDPQERAQLQEHLVSYLKVGSATPLPLANRGFTSEDFKAAAQSQASAITHAEYESLDKLTLFLQQLHHEFDAFGTSAPAQTIMSELAKINVETDVTELVLGVPKLVTKTRPASDFVREAKRVLLDTEPGATLNMPHRWGAVSQTIADAIFTATLDALKAQYARVKPATGRYEATRAGEEPRYVLRAFIRLKAETEGCPTRLVWSQYSEPYTIAPWWESSGAPVPVIAMPDLFDPNALKALKPNVAFALPPKLANLLRKDPKKLRDGEGDGKGWEIGWICSFSLPIITLCAFIVLNIFLSLFAMIFFWLPFLKICIPYPKSK
ncbi:MAG TPA: hypothetical protein VFS42_04010 [Burkholderiaceae bacterium]|nr:hypothetical protein [Burkholderiaceae bacterium]